MELIKKPLKWLYVDFNSFFASVEQQLNPAFRNRPVIVMPVDSDYTSAIAASYEAKILGIKTGTRVAEARKIYPDIICVLANHEKYVNFHHLILKEIDRHLPVTLVKSIDEMACRLMNNEAIEEKAKEIAYNIKAGIYANIGGYMKCSIGLAPNSYLAKVATDLQKPDGLVVLYGEDVPKRLNSIMLSDLPGIGHNMEKRLQKAGIINFPTLWSKEKKFLREAWGSIWGERMWYLLRGEDLPDEETKRGSIGHSHVLGPAMRSLDKAKLIARRLVLKVASRLRRMKYFSNMISFYIRFEDDERIFDLQTCYRAQDSLIFLSLLNDFWAKNIDSLNKPQVKLHEKFSGLSLKRVKKISITLYGLSSTQSDQIELFNYLDDLQAEKRKKAENLSNALDLLNNRYGRDSVVIGMMPQQGKSFSGTKIAFNRIPHEKEFIE